VQVLIASRELHSEWAAAAAIGGYTLPRHWPCMFVPELWAPLLPWIGAGASRSGPESGPEGAVGEGAGAVQGSSGGRVAGAGGAAASSGGPVAGAFDLAASGGGGTDRWTAGARDAAAWAASAVGDVTGAIGEVARVEGASDAAADRAATGDTAAGAAAAAIGDAAAAIGEAARMQGEGDAVGGFPAAGAVGAVGEAAGAVGGAAAAINEAARVMARLCDEAAKLTWTDKGLVPRAGDTGGGKGLVRAADTGWGKGLVQLAGREGCTSGTSGMSGGGAVEKAAAEVEEQGEEEQGYEEKDEDEEEEGEKQEERGQGAHAVRSTRSPRAAPDASEASVRGAVPTAAEVWHTLARSSAVVGMHPDGATEAIIDFALATGKPFAVVPCCVYSASFPTRRDRRGRRVTSYRHFVDYLLEKAPGRIGLATLPFEGKNLVVYSLPPLPVSPPAAAADDTTADDAAEAVGDTVACVPCE
jgi:hypothetical protein